MTTSLTKAVANALSFAHLAGFGRGNPKAKADKDPDEPTDRDHEDGDAKGGGAAAEDDPERKKRDGESDDDYAKRMKKMDDDEAAASASAGDVDDEKDKDKEAKAAKDGEECDDDSDEEMRGKSASALARRREQARCAAIFASPAAARNPVLAANLAFKSRMGRNEALAVLDGTPAARSPAHAGRSDGNPRVGAGQPEGAHSTQAVAKSWDAAFAKVAPPKAKH